MVAQIQRHNGAIARSSATNRPTPLDRPAHLSMGPTTHDIAAEMGFHWAEGGEPAACRRVALCSKALEARTLLASTTPTFQPVAPNITQRVNAAMAQFFNINKPEIPGAAVALVSNGTAVVARGYGWASINPRSAATGNTPFEIASVSKTMIAIGFLKLYQDRLNSKNAINLDTPFEKYMPSINTPTGSFTLPAAWSSITPRELLSMASGIPDYGGTNPWYVQIEAVANQKLLFTPGKFTDYSNPNFYLLGALIEKLSGESLVDYLSNAIFTPLHMNNTRLLGAEQRRRASRGIQCRHRHQALRPATKIVGGPALFSDGVVTTADAMSKYIVALLNQELLDNSTYSLMWTPTNIPNFNSNPPKNAIRGLGWDTVQVNNQEVTEVTKNGGKVGAAAQLDVYNQADSGVFVAYNIAANQSVAAETVASAVYASLSTAAVRGTAVNANTGTPVWGVTVYVEPKNDGGSGTNELQKFSGREGQFLFNHLAPGDYTVTAVAPSGWQFSPNTPSSFYFQLSAESVATPSFSLVPTNG